LTLVALSSDLSIMPLSKNYGVPSWHPCHYPSRPARSAAACLHGTRGALAQCSPVSASRVTIP
jgi:hypothetical protein